MKVTYNKSKKIVRYSLPQKIFDNKIKKLRSYTGGLFLKAKEEIKPKLIQIIFRFGYPESVRKNEKNKGLDLPSYFYVSHQIVKASKFNSNNTIENYLSYEIELYIDQLENEKGYDFAYDLNQIILRLIPAKK